MSRSLHVYCTALASLNDCSASQILTPKETDRTYVHKKAINYYYYYTKDCKENSYIKTLEGAFKQTVEINRESSFVDAAPGRYSEQNATKIDTQINELDDSFQDCDINAMSTRSTNRSADDLSMDPLTDLPAIAETTHTTHRTTHHTILYLISEAIADKK